MSFYQGAPAPELLTKTTETNIVTSIRSKSSRNYPDIGHTKRMKTTSISDFKGIRTTTSTKSEKEPVKADYPTSGGCMTTAIGPLIYLLFPILLINVL